MKTQKDDFLGQAMKTFMELKELPEETRMALEHGVLRKKKMERPVVEQQDAKQQEMNKSGSRSKVYNPRISTIIKEDQIQKKSKSPKKAAEITLSQVVKQSSKRVFSLPQKNRSHRPYKEQEYEFAKLIIKETGQLKNALLEPPVQMSLDVPNYDGGFFNPHWIVGQNSVPCCVTIQDDMFRLRQSIAGPLSISFDIGYIINVGYNLKVYDYIKIEYQTPGEPSHSVQLAFINKGTFQIFDCLLFMTFIREKRKKLWKNEAVAHKLRTFDEKFRLKEQSLK